MGKRTSLYDNLTGREVTDATEYVVTIAPNGSRSSGSKYEEIVLTAESYAALVAVFSDKTDEFHKYMRRYLSDGSGKRAPRGTGTSPRSSTADSNGDETKRAREFVKTNNHKAPAIKEWGTANGLSEFVKSGPGVIPGTLVVAFAKAHGMPETAPEPPADSTKPETADAK